MEAGSSISSDEEGNRRLSDLEDEESAPFHSDDCQGEEEENFYDEFDVDVEISPCGRFQRVNDA